MTAPSDRDEEALRLAFAAPIDRARATRPGDPLDRISLREHVREVEIGAFQQERGRNQRIRFDIVAEVRPDPEAVASDDVDGILSYDTLIDAIDAELGEGRLNLLETLAERVAARILGHDRADRVFVRIEKLDRGPHLLGVEIVRSRAGAAASRAASMPRPRVVLLPGGAPDDPALPAMLDRLAGRPAILCVRPTAPAPRVAEARAQARIDLLAVEQAAWHLAARDRRCVVIDSRTELDWALRHDTIAVWAPSRLVLDAATPPEGVAPIDLARWLAAELSATELVLVGDAPAPGPVPERAAAGLAAV